MIRAEAATETLILSVWITQPWWSAAVAGADETFFLPRATGLFSPGRVQRPTTTPHWRVGVLRVVRSGRLSQPPLVAPDNVSPWSVPPPTAALPPLPFTASAT